MTQFKIESVEDVKAFFKTVHEMYPLEWHPDDDFLMYMNEDESRAFSDNEAIDLNDVMNKCFQYCDDNDLDIYDLAAEVQKDLFQSQGKWPLSD